MFKPSSVLFPLAEKSMNARVFCCIMRVARSEVIIDFCNQFSAALFGGFVGSFLRRLNPEDMVRKEIPLSEVLPQPAGGLDTGLRPQEPPDNIGSIQKFGWASEIKAVVIIPDFEVETAEARSVLPNQFSREDVVCI